MHVSACLSSPCVLTLTTVPVFEALPIVFMEKRAFTIAQNGLTFIGIGIGTSIGSIINYFASRRYAKLIKKWRGFPPLERRLFGAMIGSPILVIGIFWLCWTGQYANIPWYVPAFSTIFVGAGINLIFMSFLVRLHVIIAHTDLAHLFLISRVTSSIHICKFHNSIVHQCELS